MRPIFFIYLLALSILLSACTQIPSKDIAYPIDPQLPAPQIWSIQAKLGIRHDENNGSVIVNWRQNEAEYLITIQGSFGQGNATIRGNEQYVVIERPGQSPIFSNDANTLIEQTFGWDLPVTSFSYWVRGLHSPEYLVDDVVYDANGYIVSLQQSNWTLDYSRYQAVSGRLLPGKIRAKQAGSQLTLIIRQWQLLD